MIIAFAQQPLTFDMPLTSAGVSLPADGDPATWSLLDATMQPISGFSNQPLSLAPGATTAAITVGALGNLKSADVASRFVRLNWNSGGAARQTFQGYVIIDWAPVSATPDDARRLLGASKAEVPDADLDIWRAWMELRSQLGSTDSLARLTSTDDGGRRMNEAIACRAALNIANHMVLRLAARMSSETLSFQRFADIDLQALTRNLAALENSLLFPDTADAEAAPTAFFQLSGVAADAITGG